METLRWSSLNNNKVEITITNNKEGITTIKETKVATTTRSKMTMTTCLTDYNGVTMNNRNKN